MTKTNIAWCRVAEARAKNRQKVDFDDFNYKADIQGSGHEHDQQTSFFSNSILVSSLKKVVENSCQVPNIEINFKSFFRQASIID